VLTANIMVNIMGSMAAHSCIGIDTQMPLNYG